MFCSQCGKEVRDDDVYCIHCGSKIYKDNGHKSTQPAGSVPQNRKSVKDNQSDNFKGGISDIGIMVGKVAAMIFIPILVWPCLLTYNFALAICVFGGWRMVKTIWKWNKTLKWNKILAIALAMVLAIIMLVVAVFINEQKREFKKRIRRKVMGAEVYRIDDWRQSEIGRYCLDLDNFSLSLTRKLG